MGLWHNNFKHFVFILRYKTVKKKSNLPIYFTIMSDFIKH